MSGYDDSDYTIVYLNGLPGGLLEEAATDNSPCTLRNSPRRPPVDDDVLLVAIRTRVTLIVERYNCEFLAARQNRLHPVNQFLLCWLYTFFLFLYLGIVISGNSPWLDLLVSGVISFLCTAVDYYERKRRASEAVETGERIHDDPASAARIAIDRPGSGVIDLSPLDSSPLLLVQACQSALALAPHHSFVSQRSLEIAVIDALRASTIENECT